MVMPNFLIIGSEKAGTSSLYNYLKQHPDIYMSPEKEPMFFSDIKSPYDKLTEYQTLFSQVSTEKAIGEASTTYLLNSYAPKKIKKYIPQVKLLAILRNPVDRAYSLYNFWIREGQEVCFDFRKIIEKDIENIKKGKNISPYTRRSMYSDNISRYLRVFDKDKIKIILYEDYSENTDTVLKDVFRFLNVNENIKIDTSTKHNVSMIPKNKTNRYILGLYTRRLWDIKFLLGSILPEQVYWKIIVPKGRKFINFLRYKNSVKPIGLDAELRNKYTEIFRDDILRLQKLIERDLSHWLI